MTESAREKLTRAKALLKIGEYEKCLEVINALSAGDESKDPLVTLDVLIIRAEVSWRTGKLDDGLDAIDKAERFFSEDWMKKLEEQKEVLQQKKSNILSQAGVIYWYRGDLEEAEEKHQESLKIRESLGDKEGISIAYNNLGLVFWTKGNLDKATEYYEKSLAIYEELSDENGVSRVLNNLANISASRGELDQALEYHQQSLAIKERIASKQDVAVSLINIGVIYRLKGDLDKATEYYNKSLAIQEDINIGPEFALVLHNLGEIYNLKGELSLSLEFYQRSLLIYEAMGAKEGIVLTLINIGECYSRKGEPEIAFEYYQRGLAIAEDMGSLRLISNALSELVCVTLDNNDSKLAQEYLSKLESANSESDNLVVDQRYRLSKVLFLKKSGRTRERVEAEEILEKLLEEEITDYSLTVTAMIHLCDLQLMELKISEEENTLQKAKNLTERLRKIAEEQASHPLFVETLLLQSKLAIVASEFGQADELMKKAKQIADEKGLLRLSKIVEGEIQLLQHQKHKWETILKASPSKQEMVELTNLNELLEKMVQKTVETLGMEPKAESRKPKYRLVHQDLLESGQKSERSRFRVGIAQIGLAHQGDILNELYEVKGDGLIGLREDSIRLVREKMQHMAERAHSEHVDVLIFPEMTIDLGYEQLAEDVRKLAKQYEMYIIPGSFHNSDTRKNVCRVYGPDAILWEQEKHIPAIIHMANKRFIERIETSEKTKNTIICSTQFGRVAIAICRDFLDMDLRVELKNSDPPVDLVINPAFTPVTADFKAAHFDARRSIYAYCFFANVAEFGDSLIYTPEKDRIERNVPKGEENLIYKDVDLFQLRSERKKWEEERKKDVSFIQSTR